MKNEILLMKISLLRIYILTISLCVFPKITQATHIVGGELNYRCLGGDNYEISLVVFRDCFNGSPRAYFDDPASVGIFDVNNALITEVNNGQLRIDLMEDDTLAPVLFDECLVVPPDVCVHTTNYRDTVRLPLRPGGYQLAYQRCCRNVTILNIVDPLSTGATFYNYISEEALSECNSSAVFKEWPPFYICVNEPIIFDHSAIDPDGDSLVYSLCTPFTGADRDIPRPQPPNNPPYALLEWRTPYTLDDVLGGTPLKIDSRTGLLTGTPNTIGQFVVGVCVEEYRNGILISTSQRDFQYNIGVCGTTTAAFFNPDVFCDFPTVNFQNKSLNATDFLWTFMDNGQVLGTSTNEHPEFTFPDIGNYQVKLLSSKTNTCKDSIIEEIRILPNSLFVEYDLIPEGCIDQQDIRIQNNSYDTLSTIISYEWLVSDGQSSELEEPTFTFTEQGVYSITLTLVAENGCEKSLRRVFGINLYEVDIPDVVAFCQEEPVVLNPGGPTDLLYQWFPSAGLSNDTVASPVAYPPNDRIYHVVIETSDGLCTFEKDVRVFTPEVVDIELPEDIITCDSEIEIMATSELATNIEWSTNPFFSNIFDTGNTIQFSLFGSADVYARATDEYGCQAIDTINIIEQGTNIGLTSDVWRCIGQRFEIEASNFDPNDTLIYSWSPETEIVSSTNTSIIEVAPSENGQWFYLTTTNQFGCENIDSIYVSLSNPYLPNLDIVALPNDSIYNGEEVQLIATNNDTYFYEWESNNTLNNTSIYNPTALPSITTTYYLDIEDANGCVNRDSITIYVREVICEIPSIFIPNAFTPNNDGANDLFYVRGNTIETLQLIIYNRWGQKVFETTDQGLGWDGTLNGTTLAPDVFAYYLKVECIGGTTFIKKGNVTLIR